MAFEIATHPNDLGDGKPIFLNMGVHHAGGDPRRGPDEADRADL